jgi:hypothetical protein
MGKITKTMQPRHKETLVSFRPCPRPYPRPRPRLAVLHFQPLSLAALLRLVLTLSSLLG